MHGRPRPPKGSSPDPEKTKAQEQKAALFGKLLREASGCSCAEAVSVVRNRLTEPCVPKVQVLERRARRQYDEESMGLAAKVLELNPEVYTAWNFRREFLEPILTKVGDRAPPPLRSHPPDSRGPSSGRGGGAPLG